MLGQEGPVSFRDQFAVNGDERLIGIRTLKIQTIGNVVFAGAAFAEDHDRMAAGIHFMQRRIQVGSLCCQAEKAGKIIAFDFLMIIVAHTVFAAAFRNWRQSKGKKIKYVAFIVFLLHLNGK